MEMALISGRIKIQTCSDPSRVVYLKPNEKHCSIKNRVL